MKPRFQRFDEHLLVPEAHVLDSRIERSFSEKGTIKILFTGFYPPSPVPDADFLDEIVKASVDGGHDVIVLAPETSSAKTENPKVLPLARKWDWHDVRRVAKQAVQEKPDVVVLIYIYYLGNGHPAITMLPFLLRRLGYRGRIVTVFENQAGFARKKYPLVSAFLKVLQAATSRNAFSEHYGSILSSDRSICLSFSHAKEVSDKAKQKIQGLTVLPPFSTLVMAPFGPQSRSEGRRLLGIGEDKIVVTFFGYLKGSKRVDLLLEAADKLRNDPRFFFLIAGDEFPYDPGCEDSLKKKTMELQLQDRVHFTGSYPAGSDCASLWLHASDMAVLPFKGAVNLHNSSLSACLRHGLPTIVTEDAELSGRPDGKYIRACTKTVVDADARSLAEAISSIATNPEESERLRRAALDAYAEFYAEEGFVRGLTVFDGTRIGLDPVA
ncbi:MAG TPA: glycosyltransferase family 4 protein [Fimbriimonas sp.]|nr:glycosyltransferase family 4 protein [Fimbriimonas sp.]